MRGTRPPPPEEVGSEPADRHRTRRGEQHPGVEMVRAGAVADGS
ncbi:hypothetical protein [Thermobifida alba]|nr:hypothetical protein [Thermobifida alba]